MSESIRCICGVNGKQLDGNVFWCPACDLTVSCGNALKFNYDVRQMFGDLITATKARRCVENSFSGLIEGTIERIAENEAYADCAQKIIEGTSKNG